MTNMNTTNQANGNGKNDSATDNKERKFTAEVFAELCDSKMVNNLLENYDRIIRLAYFASTYFKGMRDNGASFADIRVLIDHQDEFRSVKGRIDNYLGIIRTGMIIADKWVDIYGENDRLRQKVTELEAELAKYKYSPN